MVPICRAGAVGEAENLDSRAARVAKVRRHLSAAESLSSTLAFTTVPWLFTVIITVTSPAP